MTSNDIRKDDLIKKSSAFTPLPTHANYIKGFAITELSLQNPFTCHEYIGTV